MAFRLSRNLNHPYPFSFHVQLVLPLSNCSASIHLPYHSPGTYSSLGNMASLPGLPNLLLSLMIHSPHCSQNKHQGKFDHISYFKSLIALRMSKSKSIVRSSGFLGLIPRLMSSILPVLQLPLFTLLGPLLSPSSLAQGFSTLTLSAFSTRLILCYGDCLVDWSIFSILEYPWPLRTRCQWQSHLSHNNQNCLYTLPHGHL